VSEAGVGRARAIWNRLSGEQRLHAATLIAALVAAAPTAARLGPGALEYPDFGLWRSLMVHLGLPDAPAWAAPTPPALNLPGFERPTATPRGRRRAG
jgi:hypothetical protein